MGTIADPDSPIDEEEWDEDDDWMDDNGWYGDPDEDEVPIGCLFAIPIVSRIMLVVSPERI